MNRMNRAVAMAAVVMMGLTAQMQGSQASHIFGATAGLVSGLWLRQKGVGDCVLAKQVTLSNDDLQRIAQHAVIRDLKFADQVAVQALTHGIITSDDKELKRDSAVGMPAPKAQPKRRNSVSTETALAHIERARKLIGEDASGAPIAVQELRGRLTAVDAALAAQDFAGLSKDEKARRIAGFLNTEESRKIEKEQDMLDNALRKYVVTHKLIQQPRDFTPKQHLGALKKLGKQQLIDGGISEETADAILAS